MDKFIKTIPNWRARPVWKIGDILWVPWLGAICTVVDPSYYVNGAGPTYLRIITDQGSEYVVNKNDTEIIPMCGSRK